MGGVAEDSYRTASSAAIRDARAALWQALHCKQHISFPERRKEREKKAKLVGKQEQRVNTKSKQARDKVWIVMPGGGVVTVRHSQIPLTTNI